eukprot:CAMPEP_0168322634 /NCGR_PEP_ID=MMETSP0213-20121227/3006_1 /TAXON_ID=151035 /ORGANISM="Euplotes harpa, Strain FSP1.4" /LENGTH=197 /DNA_ID=CAMNT_0008324559 /DNA_START=432 /DNA_END=1025 /DNA_ORIENTATION=-
MRRVTIMQRDLGTFSSFDVNNPIDNLFGIGLKTDSLMMLGTIDTSTKAFITEINIADSVNVIAKQAGFTYNGAGFAVNTNGDFAITNAVGTLTNTTTTESWVTLTPTLAVNISSSVSLDSQTPSDIVYYLSSLTYQSLLQQQSLSIDIALTCSISGGNSLTHSIVANGANPIPSWVSLDANNHKLVAIFTLLKLYQT